MEVAASQGTVSLAAQRSALDEAFPKSADKHRVHASNGVLYAAMLNQSAVTSAAAPVKGHNKFYALQVVENNNVKHYGIVYLLLNFSHGHQIAAKGMSH